MTSSLYTSMASFPKHIRYLPFGYETVINGYSESKINAGPVWAAWDSTFVKWCVGYERGKLKVRVFVTFVRTVGICRYGWLLRRTFCSGNVWFFDWVFVGVILSFLKLGKGQMQCAVVLWRIRSCLCATSLLGLCCYALHKDTVTIDTLVLRWVCCAVLSETVGCACDLSCVMRSTWVCLCCDLLQQHS